MKAEALATRCEMELCPIEAAKNKIILKAKTSGPLENTGGKPLNIVCLTTIC